MFPVRALLRHVGCPDYEVHDRCDRVACPFHHASSIAAKDNGGKRGKRRASKIESSDNSDHDDDDNNSNNNININNDDSSGKSEDVNVSTSKKVAPSVAESSKRRNAAHEVNLVGTPLRAVNTVVAASSVAARADLGRTSILHESHRVRPAPRNAYAARVSAAEASGITRASSSTGPRPSISTQTSSASSSAPSNSVQQIPSASIHAGQQLSAPLIPRQLHPAASKVPYSVRQSSLRTYFTTFVSLYAPLLPPPPRPASNATTDDRHISSPLLTSRTSSRQDTIGSLLKRVAHRIACEDALESENKIFKMSNTNPTTYRNSVRTDLVSLARRKKQDQTSQLEGKACIGKVGIEMIRLASSPDKEEEKEQHDAVNVVEDKLHRSLRQSHLIGTSDEANRKTALLAEQAKGMMNVERLESAELLANTEQLRLSNFPMPPATGAAAVSSESGRASWENLQPGDVQDRILEHWGLGGTQPDLVGHEVTCERCDVPYVVKAIDKTGHEAEACVYHWGKCRTVRQSGRVRGPRERRWTCCEALDESSSFTSGTMSLSDAAKSSGFSQASGTRRSVGVAGCTRGPHVFKEEQDKLLHRRVPFISSDALLMQCGSGDDSDVFANNNTSITHQVLAFDCELIYTTAGMSLARLTVLDERGNKVLDRHVCPHAAIVDYNTRFSGIHAADIIAAEKSSLEDARKALGQLMNSQTILVGHGLENDLRAIRLVHTRIVDSALLFPHARGLPFRMSLRELSRIHLGRYIQRDDEEAGHDPEEDAKAALDLVRLKYRDESQQASRPESSTAIASKPQAVLPATLAAEQRSPVSRLSTSSLSLERPTLAAVTSAPSQQVSSSLFLPPVRRK